LKALVPEVLVMAIARDNTLLQRDKMKECLALLNQEQETFLDACTEERPLMSCAAQVSRTVMRKLVFQMWWPVDKRRKSKREERRLALNAVELAAKSSCLENKIMSEEKRIDKDLRGTTKSTWFGQKRFEQVHCPYIRGRIDADDGDDSDVGTGFSDKVWLAVLHGHAAAVTKSPSIPMHCPQIMPFALAYCSHTLKCGEQSSRSSIGSAANQLITKADKNGDGILDDAEGKAVWDEITTEMRNSATWNPKYTAANAARTHEQRVFLRDQEWTKLWAAVNVTSGSHWRWLDIDEAVQGEADFL